MHTIQKRLAANRFTIDCRTRDTAQIINPDIVGKVDDYRMPAADAVLVERDVVCVEPTERDQWCLKRVNIAVTTVKNIVWGFRRFSLGSKR